MELRQTRLWDRAQSFTRVKLCEFDSLDAAYPAEFTGADALGFHIFRSHDLEYRIRLFEGILKYSPGHVNRVLLTDIEMEDVFRVLERLAFDSIQLYPDWVGDELRTFRARLPAHIKILKVMSAKPSENFTADDGAFLDAYAAVADAILLDSVREGGSGKTSDWDHCARIVERSPIPVLLAGGLTATNVAEAIARVKPYGVDVETGVSDRIPNGPRIKNISKCLQFVQAVRQCDQALGRGPR